MNKCVKPVSASPVVAVRIPHTPAIDPPARSSILAPASPHRDTTGK